MFVQMENHTPTVLKVFFLGGVNFQVKIRGNCTLIEVQVEECSLLLLGIWHSQLGCDVMDRIGWLSELSTRDKRGGSMSKK